MSYLSIMEPLAERLRPNHIDEIIGQQHLVGKEGVLRKSILNGRIPSMILWGPPGVGKTTLAHVISKSLDRTFFHLTAINAGVKDIRATIKKAEQIRFFNQENPILFIDEIHRFSKSQQDSLLGSVEKGIVTLIGATTENPSFEVISALLSRCQVYVLKHLEKEDLKNLVDTAITKDEVLQKRSIKVSEYDALIMYSGGDARKLLNCLEIITNQFHEHEKLDINNKLVDDILQKNFVLFDKGGEIHYDLASAFIKSIRGSDPNAAVYYLARMIEGGEDPKFICRRMIISASEDIGLANPNALLIANACFEAVNNIGMPEGRIPMSQTAIYLASSPKSNASYMAIKKAQGAVRQTHNLPIPLSMRNAPTKLMKTLDYGRDYQYAHDYDGNFVHSEYLPDALSGNTFYEPSQNPAEEKIRSRLRAWWKKKYGY